MAEQHLRRFKPVSFPHLRCVSVPELVRMPTVSRLPRLDLGTLFWREACHPVGDGFPNPLRKFADGWECLIASPRDCLAKCHSGVSLRWNPLRVLHSLLFVACDMAGILRCLPQRGSIG